MSTPIFLGPAAKRSRHERTAPPIGPLLAILTLLVSIGAFLYFGLQSSNLPDDQQIQNILIDLQQATANQDTPRIFSHLSADFQVDGLNRQQARLETLNFFHQHPGASIVFQDPQISIRGDEGMVVVPTEILGDSGASALFRGAITATLQRELTHRFLIFPHHTWKVTSIEAANLQDIVQ